VYFVARLLQINKWPLSPSQKTDVFRDWQNMGYDFWFLITIRKLSSVEPIIFVWSVLLMEAVYIIADYTQLGLDEHEKMISNPVAYNAFARYKDCIPVILVIWCFFGESSEATGSN
jgi:hypothetical protein